MLIIHTQDVNITELFLYLQRKNKQNKEQPRILLVAHIITTCKYK